MTDIVERLRSHFENTGVIKSPTFDLVKEAADRIEELEKALEEIKWVEADEASKIASAALEQRK
jgi:hypothetical protein